MGMPELIFIFGAALVIFGPRKLPEIGRTVGKFMAQFRKASADFRQAWENEVDVEKELRELREMKNTIMGHETKPVAESSPAPKTPVTHDAEIPDMTPPETIPFSKRPSYYSDSLAEAELAAEADLAAQAPAPQPQSERPAFSPPPVPAYQRAATIAGPTLEGYEG
ncbi:MAG: twin-arginine translocase TatA/TatE family subunit [Blastocatellia bacterium]|nr:twin-arginine translocase TatA/TatE family subunit [Blastocatellia bacterium]